MTSQEQPWANRVVSVVIVDPTGSVAPWLLRTIEFACPPGTVAVTVRPGLEQPAPGSNRVAFVYTGSDGVAMGPLLEEFNGAVVAVSPSPDAAATEAAFQDGVVDVLTLQDASPADVRRAIRVMSQVQALATQLAERTTELSNSRTRIHDINNGLSAILAMAEALGDDPSLSAASRMLAEDIFEAAREIARLKEPTQGAPQAAAPATISAPGPTPMATPARESATVEEARPTRVLVIEDQPDLGRLVSLTLKSKGYEVLLAQSADDAVSLARACDWKVGAILSDIVMEGRSPNDAVSEIRRHTPKAGVVFMSAYAPDEFFARGEIPDDASFLQKPFTAAELASAIKDVLSA